jgi:hypothetical protein
VYCTNVFSSFLITCTLTLIDASIISPELACHVHPHMHSLMNLLLLCFIIYKKNILYYICTFFILSVRDSLSQVKRLYILYRLFDIYYFLYMCKSKKLHIHCKIKINKLLYI